MIKLIALILSMVMLTGCGIDSSTIDENEVKKERLENLSNSSKNDLESKAISREEILRMLINGKNISEEQLSSIGLTKVELSILKEGLKKKGVEFSISELFGDKILNISTNYRDATIKSGKNTIKVSIDEDIDPYGWLYKKYNVKEARKIIDQVENKILKNNKLTVLYADSVVSGPARLEFNLIGLDNNKEYTITPEYCENFRLGLISPDKAARSNKEEIEKYRTSIYTAKGHTSIETTNGDNRGVITFNGDGSRVEVKPINAKSMYVEYRYSSFDDESLTDRIVSIHDCTGIWALSSPEKCKIYTKDKVNATAALEGLFDDAGDIERIGISIDADGIEFNTERLDNDIISGYSIQDSNGDRIGFLHKRVYAIFYTGSAHNPDSQAVNIGEKVRIPEIPKDALDYAGSKNMRYSGRWFYEDDSGESIEFDFNTPLTADIRLMAEMVPIR